MYRGLRVAVVMPARDEAGAIADAVAGVPHFVDRVIVVDDGSVDGTGAEALRAGGRRVVVVRHPRNRGVGAAIGTGYERALELGCGVVVVMAGDGQMDPADLPALLDPICDGRADYVKGNRFDHPELWRVMPMTRIAGNVLFSWATRAVSGYWRVFDSQCGYTAITRAALAQVGGAQAMFPRYGYLNDLLARLHTVGARVVDVPVRPVYGPQWKSGIRPWTVIHPVSTVLLRAWIRRILVERELAKSAGEPLLDPALVPGFVRESALDDAA